MRAADLNRLPVLAQRLSSVDRKTFVVTVGAGAADQVAGRAGNDRAGSGAGGGAVLEQLLGVVAGGESICEASADALELTRFFRAVAVAAHAMRSFAVAVLPLGAAALV